MVSSNIWSKAKTQHRCYNNIPRSIYLIHHMRQIFDVFLILLRCFCVCRMSSAVSKCAKCNDHRVWMVPPGHRKVDGTTLNVESFDDCTFCTPQKAQATPIPVSFSKPAATTASSSNVLLSKGKPTEMGSRLFRTDAYYPSRDKREMGSRLFR